MSDQNANLDTRLVITPCTVQSSIRDQIGVLAKIIYRHNGPTDFRDIEPGMWLAFPPLR